MSLNWKFKTQGPVWSEITISNDMVFIGSNDGYIYCLTKLSGQLNWKYKYFEDSSSENDDDFDYEPNEYDEYGNELDLSGYDPDPYEPLFDRDENDAKYGGSLTVHGRYLFVGHCNTLHILDILSGTKKKILESLYQNKIIYKNGYIIYYSFVLSDSFIQFSPSGDINEYFLTIEKIESGEICIKVKQKAKNLTNLELYLEEYLIKIHKETAATHNAKESNNSDRYSIIINEEEWFLRDNESNKDILNSLNSDFKRAILYNDKLLVMNDFLIQLLKIPSLDICWERSRFEFYTGYPSPLFLNYYDWNNRNNIFVVEINSKSTLASEIVCDPVADFIHYLKPVLENGLLYISMTNYSPLGFQVVNVSSGNEIILFNKFIDILTVKRYELQQIIKRFYWRKNRTMENLVSIWKLLIRLIKRVLFVNQSIKKLNPNDFPNRLIYLGNNSKKTFRYNLNNSSKKWVVETERWIREAPLIDDEYIYIGSNNGEIVSIKHD